MHNIRIIKNDFSYEFLLGLLNSKLLDWWYQKLIPEKGRVFAEVKVVNLSKLPIINVDKNNPEDKTLYDEIIKLVETLLRLNIEIKEVKLQSKIEQLQHFIGHCECRIDQLVYQLYGLTEEEINIIEGK